MTSGGGLTFIEEVVPVTRYHYNNSSLTSYLSGRITKGALVGGQTVLLLGCSGVITLQILCQAPELGSNPLARYGDHRVYRVEIVPTMQSLR